jgi:hypothetical protein
MFEYTVTNDLKRRDIIREVAVGKIAAHSCLTQIVRDLKISVEQGRVVTTLNIIKHKISYLI